MRSPRSLSPLWQQEFRITLLAALPLVACFAGLLALYDLGDHPYEFLALMGAAFLALVLAARGLEHRLSISGNEILLVAVLLRALVFPLPPSLSDDILRYVWDGRVVTGGFNPYRLEPAAEELTGLRDELWQRLPHRQVPTVYPPLALAAFSITALLPKPAWALKALLSLADLLGCLLLLRLARSAGLPPGRTVWYAWNPLVVVEVAGMGHVDSLGVTASILTVLYLCSRRSHQAAAAAAAGVLAKLVPLVALPLWARQSGRPLRFLLVAAGALCVCLLPLLVATEGIPRGLMIYGISWEFNGPVYEPLWRALDGLDASTAIKAGLDRLKALSGRHEMWNPVYPWVYPQLLAKLLLAAGFGVIWVLTLKCTDPVSGSARLFGGLLLMSATLYPWYLLWVLPWAALRRQPAWLLLTATIQLSYLPQLVGVPLFPWIFTAIWAPFAVLLLRRPRWSTA